MSRILATSCSSKLITNLFQNAIFNPTKLKTDVSSSSSKIKQSKNKLFNTPHPPKDPPENYNPSCVNHEAFDVPDFIPAAVFRPFSSNCETLGPGADKRGCYKNAEYYSYHRYSFVALQILCLKLRDQSKMDGSIRCIYDNEDTDDEKYSTDEDNK